MSVVIYLATPSDLDAAHLIVAGRPVVFRAVAAAVRAGAPRVFVPALFRERLAPALASAPRVARAVEWLDATTPAPGAVVLIPATAVVGTGALATMLAAPAPAVHEGARVAGTPIVTASSAVIGSLWSALATGAPVGPTLEKTLAGLRSSPGDENARASPATLIVREPSLVYRVHDDASAAVGERRLYMTLGSAIDTPFDVVFHRRFSRLVSRLAVAAGITPNAITVASGVVGVLAAWMFWRATAGEAVVAFGLYVIAVILDHADGEVARLTLTESAIGEWLDIVVDTVIHSSVVLALGVTSAAVTGQGMTLGIIGALGIIASAAVMKVWPALAMPDRLGTAIAGLGSRDGFYAMLVAFIVARAAWPAALPWLMIVVAAGSHAYWVGRVLYRVTRGA